MRSSITSLIDMNLKLKEIKIVKKQPIVDKHTPIEVNQLNDVFSKKESFKSNLTTEEIESSKKMVNFEIKELENILKLTEAKMNRVKLFELVPELQDKINELNSTLESAKNLLVSDTPSDLIQNTDYYSDESSRRKESIYAKYI